MEYSVIVGLGNPGGTYAATRHNIGARVVLRLAELQSARPWRSSREWRLSWTDFDLEGEKMYLLRPETFMNVSGEAIAPFLGYHKLPIEKLLVVHDEIDVEFGTLRLKHGGGHAGHNGIRSVAHSLGSAEFGRVRVGVGRPTDEREVADWVLAAFTREEEALLPAFIGRAADACLLACRAGLKRAQSQFH